MSDPDDQIESRLKYNRMPNGAKTITSNDSITCMAIHPKFIVVGTEWGNIYFLDSQGNICFNTMSLHSRKINQLSIDKEGEYIASCSDDQKVMVSGLFDSKTQSIVSFGEPIKAIAISPNFKKTNQFITGDHRLIIVSKGFFREGQKVFHQCKTKLQNIKWRKDIAVCACADCVYVFDMKELKLIGIIEMNAVKSDLKKYKCQIYWINNSQFLLGWCHEVHLCEISDDKNFTTSNSSLNNYVLRRQTPKDISRILPGAQNIPKKVQGIYAFNHADMILGLVNYGSYILALVDPVSEKERNNRDDLLVVILEHTETNPEKYNEILGEKIQLRGLDKWKASQIDVIFEKLPGENEFLIASSKDILNVRERDIDERVKWLLEKNNFKRALMLLQQPEAKNSQYSFKEVGMKYITFLLQHDKPKEATDLCKSLVDDVQSWEIVIEEYHSHHCIEHILPYIPINENMRLSLETYQKILTSCYHNITVFHSLIQTWPSSIYSVEKTIHLILKDHLNSHLFSQPNSNSDIKPAIINHRDKLVLRCVAMLYEHDQRYSKAFEIYIRIKDPYVFEMIPKRNMFEVVIEKMNFLLSHDRTKTLELLMEYMSIIPPETVVKVLQPIPQHLFYYLRELKFRNAPASEPYHLKLVHLYAEFEKEKLLAFLNSSDKYDLNEAYNLCKERKLDEEQIYLLGRMGKSREALDMIMAQKKVGSPLKAIRYCQSHNDSDLWDRLMNYGLDKPEYVTAILENTTVEEIDTKSFVNRVLANRISIPGLKNSLVQLLINNEERASLLQSHQTARWRDLDEVLRWGSVIPNSCSRVPIICDDIFTLNECNNNKNATPQSPPIKMNKNDQSSFSLVNESANQISCASCPLCGKSLHMCSKEFIMLRCKHFYHTDCLDCYFKKQNLMKNFIIEEFRDCFLCSRS